MNKKQNIHKQYKNGYCIFGNNESEIPKIDE